MKFPLGSNNALWSPRINFLTALFLIQSKKTIGPFDWFDQNNRPGCNPEHFIECEWMAREMMITFLAKHKIKFAIGAFHILRIFNFI
jgi:hypothetical protein